MFLTYLSLLVIISSTFVIAHLKITNIFMCLIQLGPTVSYAGPFAAVSLAGVVII